MFGKRADLFRVGLFGNEKSKSPFEECWRHFKYCSQDPTRLGLLRTTNLEVRSEFCFARWTSHKHSPYVFREAQLLATFWASFHDIIRHEKSIPALVKYYQSDWPLTSSLLRSRRDHRYVSWNGACSLFCCERLCCVVSPQCQGSCLPLHLKQLCGWNVSAY